MPAYKTCTRCGAHLDPGERCDCLDENTEQWNAKEEIITADSGRRTVLLPEPKPHRFDP